MTISGIPQAIVPVRSTDMDGNGSTDLADLNLFRSHFFELTSGQQSDFTLDGETTLADLNILRPEVMSSATGTICP